MERKEEEEVEEEINQERISWWKTIPLHRNDLFGPG